jgi:hypothetical protein
MSYLWKPKLGKTIGLFFLVKVMPSRKVRPHSYIKKAIMQEAERETPA